MRHSRQASFTIPTAALLGAAMRTATDLLSQYAAYHRDRRNIVSHLVGVPMIVFAIGVLLARPSVPLGGRLALTPAWVIFALAAAWYLTRGSVVLGVAVTAVVGVLIALAHKIATARLARLGRRLLPRRLDDPVRRPLVRGQEARLRRRPGRPARRSDVHRRRGDVRARLEPAAARRDRAQVGPTVLRDLAKIARHIRRA